jgi:hypothetical protein
MRILRETMLALVVALSLPTACATRLELHNMDRDVISAVVRQMCKQKMSGYVVLSSATATVNPAFTPESLDDSARRSLLERNKVSVALPDIDTCESLRLVDGEEIEHYLGVPGSDFRDRWVAFYEKFADASGVMSLSLPGYSKEGDIAVVQIASSCGETCGGGSFWVLRKVSGQWSVEFGKVVEGWQS